MKIFHWSAVLSVAIESLCYMVVQYLLASAIISFHSSLAFILFFAVNTFVISSYLEALEQHLPSRPARYGLLALCLAVTALFAWCFGFLAMALLPFS